MTHTIQILNSYLTNPLTDIVYAIIKAFRNFGEALVIARQEQANFEIAKLMKSEYPNESFDYVLRLVRAGKLGDLK